MAQRSSAATAAGNGAGVDAARLESDEAEHDDADDGFEVDQMHLQMMKRVCGGPPAQVAICGCVTLLHVHAYLSALYVLQLTPAHCNQVVICTTAEGAH